MKFAFLIMGDFDSNVDRKYIGGGVAQIIGVSSMDDACNIVKELYEDGVDCIEVCGAFKEEGARFLMEATENKIPIGYVTSLKEQAEHYQRLFGEVSTKHE